MANDGKQPKQNANDMMCVYAAAYLLMNYKAWSWLYKWLEWCIRRGYVWVMVPRLFLFVRNKTDYSSSAKEKQKSEMTNKAKLETKEENCSKYNIRHV